MAFGFRKQKSPDEKSNSDVTRKRNSRGGDALTENTEGFKDLYWP